MRGKGWTSTPFLFPYGITPAYAGKSLSFPLPIVRVIGSPPPMRGKERVTRHIVKYLGITPAYAGKSSHCRSHRCNSRDHPRLCGEKCIEFAGVANTPGSPPPMRGKGAENNFSPMSNRITPAYAGKSVLGDPRRLLSGDHPRLCGEKLPVLVYPLHVQGSPPPMRGKASRNSGVYLGYGITPAYAGKSTF